MVKSKFPLQVHVEYKWFFQVQKGYFSHSRQEKGEEREEEGKKSSKGRHDGEKERS